MARKISNPLSSHPKPIDNGHCARGKPAKVVHDSSFCSISERTIKVVSIQLWLPVCQTYFATPWPSTNVDWLNQP